MNELQKYEQLIEEFSYKCYGYVGDSIPIAIKEEGETPIFAMKDAALEGKLNQTQKEELNKILNSAMVEVLKAKPKSKRVKEYLGWS